MNKLTKSLILMLTLNILTPATPTQAFSLGDFTKIIKIMCI